VDDRLPGCNGPGRGARQAPRVYPWACPHPPRAVLPLATVERARAHAAALESASRSRTGRGRSGRASQPAPCRRGQRGTRAEPSSRTGIPLLRLPVGSKGREVLELAVAHHVGPPLKAKGRGPAAPCPATRPGEGSVAGAGGCVPANGLGRTASGDRLAFGRKDGRQSLDRRRTRQPPVPAATAGVKGAGTSGSCRSWPLASFTHQWR
jgi:hypothetical protein